MTAFYLSRGRNIQPTVVYSEYLCVRAFHYLTHRIFETFGSHPSRRASPRFTRKHRRVAQVKPPLHFRDTDAKTSRGYAFTFLAQEWDHLRNFHFRCTAKARLIAFKSSARHTFAEGRGHIRFASDLSLERLESTAILTFIRKSSWNASGAHKRFCQRFTKRQTRHKRNDHLALFFRISVFVIFHVQ
jgi:hypothetical protein